VAAKKRKKKQLVGSSSVPLPFGDVDALVSKPAFAWVKTRVRPILFNQYGSNISMAEAFQVLSHLRKEMLAGSGSGGENSPTLVSSQDLSD
jgi:hypothetical protein